MKLDRKVWLLIAGSASLLLLALILLAAAVSAAYRPPAGQDPPKVTDWMQAWGSVYGVLAGLAAAGAATALLMFERGQAREARAQLDAERAKAELSAARALVVVPARFSTVGHDGREYIHDARVDLYNYGPTPMRHLVVVFMLPEDGQEIAIRALDLLMPGQQRQIEHHFDKGLQVSGSWKLTGRPAARCYFMDANNKAWCMTSSGVVGRTDFPYLQSTERAPDEP
ncbi:hypothetical protein ACIBOV_06535 [Micromonospora chersina]|uniref:hypothetical protein n=1 Tax=Micromonospora chersina TaxID=47854 RepID=UPI003798184D